MTTYHTAIDDPATNGRMFRVGPDAVVVVVKDGCNDSQCANVVSVAQQAAAGDARNVIVVASNSDSCWGDLATETMGFHLLLVDNPGEMVSKTEKKFGHGELVPMLIHSARVMEFDAEMVRAR